MAQNQLISTLTALSNKIESLLEENKRLREKVEWLGNQNIVLENQHQKDLKLIEANQKDVEFLKFSHRLADSPDTIISARRKINGLIRTINSCIRMINEE